MYNTYVISLWCTDSIITDKRYNISIKRHLEEYTIYLRDTAVISTGRITGNFSYYVSHIHYLKFYKHESTDEILPWSIVPRLGILVFITEDQQGQNDKV